MILIIEFSSLLSLKRVENVWGETIYCSLTAVKFRSFLVREMKLAHYYILNIFLEMKWADNWP